MTQKKLFRTIGAFATALMIITLAGACNGLLPGDQPGDDGTANGGGNVIVELGGLPADAFAPAAQSRAAVQFATPREYINYYEVYFYRRNPAPATIVAKAESVRGESRLVLNVPSNEDVTVAANKYEILVLAGAYANGDSTNGEKVLLASGYKKEVTVRAGVRNIFPVNMYEVKARVDVWGVPKGTAPGTAAGVVGSSPTTPPLIGNYKYNFANSNANVIPMSPTTGTNTTGLNYVQLEKQVAPYNSITAVTGNPWAVSTTTAHKLTIGVVLTNLDPLIYAAKGGTATPTVAAGFANSIFATTGHEARIVTVNTTRYAMPPITFKYDGRTASPATYPLQNGDWDFIGTNGQPTGTTNPVGVTQWESVPDISAITGDTQLSTTTQGSIRFQYSLAAWLNASPYPSGGIPDSDAAGVFYFNYKYWPFGLESAGSVWNIRNRLLWSNGRYYGGGVVLLFGNAGTEWVEVIPQY